MSFNAVLIDENSALVGTLQFLLRSAQRYVASDRGMWETRAFEVAVDVAAKDVAERQAVINASLSTPILDQIARDFGGAQ